MTQVSPEDETRYRSLDPGQLKVLRARGALLAAALLLAAAVPAVAIGDRLGALFPLAAALLGALAMFVFPGRRYRATRFLETPDELFVETGVLVRTRTVVPFGRVQHSDVAQGPLQRRFKVATLTLHTAGTVGGSVDLPGLGADEAEAMRDRVRARIRQELM